MNNTFQKLVPVCVPIQEQEDRNILHRPVTKFNWWSHSISVTRLGDILDFGQLFKAFGNN